MRSQIELRHSIILPFQLSQSNKKLERIYNLTFRHRKRYQKFVHEHFFSNALA